MRVRDKEKKSAGILLATADAVVLVLSFLVAAALMLSYLAPHVDPRRAAWFAFLGLAAPFLYVADVVLALYWTMRWRPVACCCCLPRCSAWDMSPNFSVPS